MTKQELIEMVGDKGQAEYAIYDVLLKHIDWGFVEYLIKTEIKEIENEIKTLRTEGIICIANGSYHVNRNQDNDQDKCYTADTLLYRLHRTRDLLAVR